VAGPSSRQGARRVHLFSHTPDYYNTLKLLLERSWHLYLAGQSLNFRRVRMVATMEVKRSKVRNFQTHHKEYPRDFWEFLCVLPHPLIRLKLLFYSDMK
jgi:hypothetical protein